MLSTNDLPIVQNAKTLLNSRPMKILTGKDLADTARSFGLSATSPFVIRRENEEHRSLVEATWREFASDKLAPMRERSLQSRSAETRVVRLALRM